MIIYILGILTGVIFSILAVLCLRRYQTPLERTFNQVENKLKVKGEIFVETPEEVDLENFISNLPNE